MMSNSNDDDDDGGKSAKQMAVPLLRRRLNPAVLGIVVIAITAAFLMFSSSVPKQNGHGEDLLIYDFRSGYAEPPHLTPINVTNDIIPREDLFPIDATHRQGLIHSGTWICIQDSEGKSLVLKRSSHVVTCPNSYSLLGEHTLGAETPEQTLRRGISEEIGTQMLKHITRITALPSSPLYYFRDYGPTNGNRIDRQVTYLWYVEMDRPGAQLPLHIDKEVAKHDWIDDATLETWFAEAHTQLTATGSTGSRVCHETVLTLWDLLHAEVQQIKKDQSSR